MTVAAPTEWVESVCNLCLPPDFDERIQELMDRNNEGQLNPDERAELERLVEWSERLSIVRGTALHLLGRVPE